MILLVKLDKNNNKTVRVPETTIDCTCNFSNRIQTIDSNTRTHTPHAVGLRICIVTR